MLKAHLRTINYTVHVTEQKNEHKISVRLQQLKIIEHDFGVIPFDYVSVAYVAVLHWRHRTAFLAHHSTEYFLQNLNYAKN